MSETYIDRNTAITEIKAALRRRSGKTWSVTGGRGTAWGWIRIKSTPARAQDEFGTMTDAEATELNALLGFDGTSHFQGISIPASNDYYREYIDRANGRTPSVNATPYWD